MNSQDLQNNEIIKNLVSKHFSLKKESLDYFIKEIDNTSLLPFYKNILEKYKSTDLRIYLELPRELAERLDKGWTLFREYFKSFYLCYGLTYENFVDNRVTIDKNDIKLRKALIKFYNENPRAIESLRHASDFAKIRAATRRNNFGEIGGVGIGLAIQEPVPEIEIKKEEEPRQFNLEKVLDKLLDTISQNCLPKSNNVKIVLSLNYADWFLCSTAESWKSCLNLESEFHASYWTGLPGLIGDKNRCLFYITDGSKKNYMGIRTDKIISRIWGLLDSKEVINLIKSYPLDNMIDDSVINTIFKFDSTMITKNPDFVSKVPVNLLYFNNKQKITNYIFQDFTCFSSTHLGSLRLGGRNSYYVYFNDKLIRGIPTVEYTGGLSYLIKRGEEIGNYMVTVKTCTFCGKPVSRKETIVFINEQNDMQEECVCEECMGIHFVRCSDCGTFMLKKSSFYKVLKVARKREKIVCKSCETQYEECEDCGELYRRGDLHNLKLKNGTTFKLCSNCISERDIDFTVCNTCNSLFEKGHPSKAKGKTDCKDCEDKKLKSIDEIGKHLRYSIELHDTTNPEELYASFTDSLAQPDNTAVKAKGKLTVQDIEDIISTEATRPRR